MIRLICSVIVVAVLCNSVYAVDPPGLDAYKEKILGELENTYVDIDSDYDARFTSQTTPETASINKPVSVYYDGAKAFWELRELFNDRTGYTAEENQTLDKLTEYYEKAKRIIAVRSIAKGGGGYQCFPHGMFYYYQEMEDRESLDGLVGLRDIGGGFIKAGTATNERVMYSREIAYTIQTIINTDKAGIPRPDHDYALSWYLNMAKSHMTQWHTGNFYDDGATPNYYMSPFIVGLTIDALIEYYERVRPDPEIPPLIKSVIDVIWNRGWWHDIDSPSPSTYVDYWGNSDTYGYYHLYTPDVGGVWHWLNWVAEEGTYFPDANNMPSAADVSFDNNGLLIDAYMWYALYSGDDTYRVRAEAVWDGMRANTDITASYRLFEGGARHLYKFIRHYREYFSTPCAGTDIEQCTTASGCVNAGGNWTGEWCQHASVAVMSAIACPTASNPDHPDRNCDCDVDGRDLAEIITAVEVIQIETTANNFGQASCP